MKYVYDKGLIRRSLFRVFAVFAVATFVTQAIAGVLYTKDAGAEGGPTTVTVLQTDFANSMSAWTYHDDIKDSTDPLNAATPTPTVNHLITSNPTPSQANNGAVKLTASSGQKWNLATLRYSGTKLADITSLKFDVYSSAPRQSYVNVDVNFNSWEHGPGSLHHGRLVYMPQNLNPNTWKSYDAVSDGLWSWSRGETWPDGVTGPRTWQSIAEEFPNAYISSPIKQILLRADHFGGVYFRADGDAPVTAYYDNVQVTTTTQNTHYNFELPKPTAPMLIAPANNAIVSGGSLTNSWSSVPGAQKYVYESYHDASATSLRWREEFTTTSKTATSVPDATFWWRVKAVDVNGVSSDWSELRKVTVDNTAPVWSSTPYHVWPNDPVAEVTVGSEIIMDWVDANDANPGVTYQYQVSFSDELTGSDGAFAHPIWTWDKLSESKLNATGTGPGTYYWHVKACDAADNCTRWTDPWKGTVVEATAEDESTDAGESLLSEPQEESAPQARQQTRTGGQGGTTGTAVLGQQTSALPIRFAIAGTPTSGTDDIPTIGTDVEETGTDALGQVLGAEQTLGQATGGIGGNLQDGSLLTEPRVIAPAAVILSGGLFWWLVAAWRRRSEY